MKGLAIVFALFFSIIYTTLEGQSVGVSTNGAAPDQSAMLDVSSTSKGMLIPRMTSTQRAAITSPAEGLLVYDTNTDEVWYFSTTWRPIAGSGGLSDMDNDTKIIVEETTDDDKVRIYIAGEERVSIYDNTNGITRINVDAKGFNTLIGQLTGEELDNTIGSDAIQNVFVGFVSGRYCTTGYNNTFLGALAGMETTTGSYNTYLGQGAGLNHTGSGSSNTLVGGQAGSSMTTGFDNTILGYQAGYLRTGGQGNTLLGLEAGNTASGGSGNVMIGKRAGKGSTQSNSLYIDNTDTTNPLIYGEFNNDLVRVNGQFEVKVGGHEMAKFDGKTLHLMAPDSSLFIGKDAGLNDDGTGHQSTGIGFEALKNDATGWNNTAIGFQALSAQDAGDNNTAVGVQAMHNTHYGDFNVAVGAGALFDNTSGANNVALGYQALRSNTGAKRNVAIGNRASYANTVGQENISIGNSALYSAETTNRNIAIGDSSLYLTGISASGNYEGSDNIALGSKAGFAINRGYGNIAIGTSALSEEDDPSHKNTIIGYGAGVRTGIGENTMLGAHAGGNFADGEQNVFIGNYAGENNVASQNTFVGYSAGRDNEGEGNVFLGNQAGALEENAVNTLIIANSNTSSPLIYGEFDNDLLRVNGELNINGEYSLPTIDGAANQVLKTDGIGNISWGSSSATLLQDSDGDTKITVEENPDEDIIRFNIAGVEVATLDADNFELDSGGESVFIGKNTGSNDDGTDNRNTAVGADVLTDNTTGYRNVALGRNALKKNTIGFTNVAIGNGALYENIGGDRNVALGYQSLYASTGNDNVAIGMYAGRNIGGSRNISIGFESNLHNAGGNNTIIGYHAGRGTSGDTKSGNVFLGYEAGKAESGSNKLIIENSSSTTPLIYGEFDNDLVRINGDLEIGMEYKLPSTDGSADQVMKTDGAGNLSWGNESASQWEDQSNNIIFTSGNVGIGVVEPSSPLHAGSFGSTAKIETIGISLGDKTALTVSAMNASGVTSADSVVGIRAFAGGSVGANIALLAEVGNNTDLAAKFDGKVVLGTSNNTSNQVLISPSSTSSGGNSSLFFGEDTDGTYGMFWEYNGTKNELGVFGYLAGTTYGSHLTINREDGKVAIGNNKIVFDPDFEGDSRIITDEIEIRGGSDLAEFFEVDDKKNPLTPGMIVSIDTQNEGGLKVSDQKYSRLVVGVISGAHGIETGMFMGQKGSIADGETPVAIAGRVYVIANNEGGEIRPGDFLTSSSIVGEAMKAEDMTLAQGAIIGKAMTSLDEDGFVLVLVNLQ